MAKNKKMAKKPVKKGMKKMAAKTKKKKVLSIPKGYHSITPYLLVNNAKEAMNFYKKAFGAKIAFCLERSDRKVAHAELKIGDSKIMLADPCPEKSHAPDASNGSAIVIHLYVKDVDNVVTSALKAGAEVVQPVENMFYGDRAGCLKDPYGHTWYIATHVEDVSPSKIKKRASDLFSKKQ
jgi:PhnB protein